MTVTETGPTRSPVTLTRGRWPVQSSVVQTVHRPQISPFRLARGRSRPQLSPDIVFVARREFGSSRQLADPSGAPLETDSNDWVVVPPQVRTDESEEFESGPIRRSAWSGIAERVPEEEASPDELPAEESLDGASEPGGWTPPQPAPFCEEPRDCWQTTWWGEIPAKIGLDYREFYSPRSLIRLGAGFGVGAILANTTIDQKFDAWYHDSISSGSNSLSTDVKNLGEGGMVVPVILATALVSHGLSEYVPVLEPIDTWSTRSMRAYLVGGPAMLIMQKVTGASRPLEIENASHWDFWADNNGVSGHSFVGAVPFLTAARMVENPWAKAGLYAGSFAAGWSRVNDQDHFLSQALLGWWMAYMAVEAVDRADDKYDNLYVGPTIFENGAVGVLVDLRY